MRETEPADMAFVPLDREQAAWLNSRGDEPSHVLLALLKGAMGRMPETAPAAVDKRFGHGLFVTLDANEAEWLRAHGDDPAQALLAVLRAEIRRETLKKAVAEEHYVRSLLRKHAGNLERRREKQLPPPPIDYSIKTKLERQAERELLPSLERSADERIRAAVRRYRFRFGIKADGTHTNTLREGTPALQRMREQRPGGWR
jgi:hypothetical protein